MAPKKPSTVAFRFVKAGSIDVNPMTLTAKAGAALRNIAPGTTIVTVREDSGLGHYFIAEGYEDEQKAVAFAAGQSVSARVEPADIPNLSMASAVASLEFQRGSIVSSSTQMGAEIGAVVETVATSLLPGEWIAMAIRHPTKRELRRYQRWMSFQRVMTHHSLNINAVVVSMWAGGHSPGNAQGLLRRVSGALPGFDLRTEQKVVTAAKSMRTWLAAAGVLAAVTGVATWLGAPTSYVTAGFVGAGVLFLCGGLSFSGHIPSRFSRLQKLFRQGLVPPPPRRVTGPKRPVAATMKDGVEVPAQNGDYPLAAGAFLVGAHLPIAIAAPHAGAESGTSSTRSRVAPPALRERIGPMIGTSGDHDVHLDVGDLWKGIMCIGEAGSGKSALLQALFGYASLDKAHPSGVPGSPGVQHAIIGLDTKGDGLSAMEYEEWAKAAHSSYVRFDVADTTATLGLDLFPDIGTAKERALRVVSAMVYFYGDVSIGPESYDTLVNIMTAAYMVTPDIAAQVPGVNSDASVFYYANILVSNRGDELGKALAVAITDKAVRENALPGTDLGDAAEALLPAYAPARTPAQRAQLMKAPRTKVSRMAAAEHWWARPQKTSWQRILENHATVIINTGRAPGGQSLDDETAGLISSMLMFTLRQEIAHYCTGWFDTGQAVSIFADEVKQIAGSNAAVVQWLRNDGRGWGVRPVFATQYPEQLDRVVRDAVMGFGTLIAYAQQNPDMIKTIVNHLQADGSEWEGADIASLPKYEAVVKTQVNGSAQTPFTLSIPEFRAQRGTEYATRQGF